MHHQGKTLNEPYKACIAACWSCAEMCNECGDDMIGMPAHGDRELMARCIRQCRDCADICAMSAQWMSRLSPFVETLCRVCADVCDSCAEVCEQHAPHHALCGPCAQVCRQCARQCRDMAAAHTG